MEILIEGGGYTHCSTGHEKHQYACVIHARDVVITLVLYRCVPSIIHTIYTPVQLYIPVCII